MLHIRRLAASFAAAIEGLDLASPLPDAMRRELREALERHAVLLVRGAVVGDEQHLALARSFGTLERFPPARDGVAAGPELLVMTNVLPGGGFAAADGATMRYLSLARSWHKDASFRRTPSFATILHAIEVPPTGGDTLFVDLRAAYDRLPARERDRLGRLAAVHSYDAAAEAAGVALARAIDPDREAIHPLVARHADGRRSLYLSPLYMRDIVGMDRAASDALVNELVQESTVAACTYRHAWAPGDVLLWDNRSVMHRATPYADRTAARTLHRTVVAGEGYVDDLWAMGG